MQHIGKNEDSDFNAASSHRKAWILAFLSTVLFSISLVSGLCAQECSSVAVEAGYHDYNYGTVVEEELTAEKPESKLWHNDGSWWGVLWVPSSNKYRIHRFDEENECFANVGPDVDDRVNARADVLWDGQFLYISSHTKGSGSSDDSARLLRYSYNTGSQSYSLDDNFPVVIHEDETEASTITKDSSGQLWAAWTVDGDVMVNRTLRDDFSWGTPFVLPAQGSQASSDDLAGIIAFAPDRIGVMWSDQNEDKIKFAVHRDSAPDQEWEPEEDALHDESLGSVADDHLNIACNRSTGELIAITKSSISDPAVFLLKRDQNGVWTNTSFGAEDYTRPIVLMNTENDSIYAISKAKTTPVKVYYKTTHLSNPVFDPGIGNVLIEHATSIKINNPTSTKQPVNASTGLLVLASDKYTQDYYHRFLNLSGTASNDATEFDLLVSIEGNGSVSPAGGDFIDGTQVQLTAIPAPGWIFFEWQGDVDGGNNPTVLTMNSDKDITARFIEDEPLSDAPSFPSISDDQVAERLQGLATSMMQEIPNPENFSIMDWRMVNALYGMLRAYQYTGENEYLDYILRWANAHINGAGDLDEPIIDTFTGGLLLELFKITGNDRFLQPGIQTKDYMESEFQRLGNGTFVHTNIDQIWVDTLFGLIRFLIPLAEVLDDPSYLDEAANQIILHASILQDTDTGLFYHGWDEDGSAAWANPNTHLSPEFWSRGNGWVIASLVDLLEKLPASHSKREDLIQILEALSQGLADTQDQTTGLWYTVLTRPEDDDNYLETSGSSLFLYGLSKAIKLGLISDAFQDIVNLGWIGLDNLSYDEASGVHYVILVSEGTNVGDMGYYYGRAVGSGYDYVYGHGVYLEALYVRLWPDSGIVQASVTTEAIGQGQVYLEPPGGIYEVGTVIDVIAQAETGWQFDGWEGEMNGHGNPSSITVNENKIVTARFVENLPDGTHLFNPVADTYIKVGSSSNYGDETFLRNKTSSSTYQTFLKFAVTGLSGTVQQAILHLYVEDPGDGGSLPLYIVSNDYGDGSGPWLEAELSGLNSPGTGDAFATSTPLTEGSWIEFDVTAAVNGNNDFSFCVNTPLSNSVYLSSKEGTHPPELVIETGAGIGPSQYILTTSVQGNGSVDPSGGSYDVGTEVALTAQPATGWHFVEWQGDAGGTNPQTTITMDGNNSVTAIFSEIPPTQYTLSTSVQGNGSVDPSSGSYDEGTEVTLTAQPASGWQFVEWQGDVGGTSPQTTITIDGNKNVTAVFQASNQSSNIVLNPTEDSHVKEGSDKNYGDEQELRSKTSSSVYHAYLKFDLSGLSGPAETATLRLFVNDEGSGGPISVHAVSNFYQGTGNPWLETGIESGNAPDLTGSPVFTLNSLAAGSWAEFDVTSAVNGAVEVSFGLVNPDGSSIYFSSKEGDNSPELVIGLGSGGGITQYSLSTEVQGNGSVDPSGGSYDEGTQVTLTAQPASGWQFVEWQGDASGSNNQTSITMDDNKSVTAVFSENPTVQYDLTTSVQGDGSVAPSAGSYDEGAIVTLSAQAASGWQFVEWQGDASGSNAQTSITMDGHKDVTATFTEITASVSSTYFPVADTYVKSGSSSNYGDSDVVRIKTSSSTYYGYLKFAVDDLTGPAIRATLRLFVTDQGDGDGVSVYAVANEYEGTTTPWDESGLNSENAPVTGTAAVNSLNSISENSWAEFDVTTIVTGNDSYSFVLTTQSSDSKRFSSKEGDNPPELVVEIGAPLAKQITSAPEMLGQDRHGPREFALDQNYPNPFNPETTIRYQLPQAVEVRLVVFDSRGRLVSVLVDGQQNPGVHSVTWKAVDLQGDPLPSGLYFYRLLSHGHVRTMKMLLVH